MIGIFIGKTLGYAVQGLAFSKVSAAVEGLTPVNLVFVRAGVKCGIKYSVKLVNYTCENHIRQDFSSTTLLSDAIDASFFAD